MLFIMLLPLQGAWVYVIYPPRVLPWAMCFWALPFRFAPVTFSSARKGAMKAVGSLFYAGQEAVRSQRLRPYRWVRESGWVVVLRRPGGRALPALAAL